MAAIPIEIACIGKEIDEIPINNAIQVINSRQNAFRFSIVEHESFLTFHPKDQFYTNIQFDVDLYKLIRKFRKETKDFHPYMIALVKDPLTGRIENTPFSNIFGTVEKRRGKTTGLAVLTIFQAKEILGLKSEEIYLIFFFIYFALRFLISELETHLGNILCPCSLKRNKVELIEVIKHGKFCSGCNELIFQSLSSNQVNSINTILSIISDIYNSKNPNQNFAKLQVITNQFPIQKLSANEIDLGNNFIYSTIHDIIETEESQLEVINYSELKILVAEGSTEKVFQSILGQLNESSQYFNELVTLFGWYSHINHEEKSGKITFNEKIVQINKINLSLLKIIELIQG